MGELVPGADDFLQRLKARSLPRRAPPPGSSVGAAAEGERATPRRPRLGAAERPPWEEAERKSTLRPLSGHFQHPTVWVPPSAEVSSIAWRPRVVSLPLGPTPLA